MGLSLILKSTPTNLAYNLTHDEFKCRCHNSTCHYTLISPLLALAWNNLRTEWAEPLKVNSGFRCQIHNSSDHVKGIDRSRHTMGLAIDISIITMTNSEKDSFKELAEKHFDVVIDYGSFLHCHMELRHIGK